MMQITKQHEKQVLLAQIAKNDPKNAGKPDEDH